MTSHHDKSRPPPKDLTTRPSYTALHATSFLIPRDHCSSRGAAKTLRNGYISRPVVRVAV